MKKMRIVYPVLFLVCAGMVMMSCPSDPNQHNTIDDPDIVLAGGKYQYLFDTPPIEHGKEYEVIFTIEECDEGFVGSRLGGKISYKMNLTDGDDAEKVLSGWDYAVPPTVSADTHTYKWTFKAGAANKDNVTIENPATTPTGGKQYFSFTAQKGWDNYGADVNFNVKGEFKVQPRDSITDWESAGTVTLGNDSGTAGKGALSEADMTTIRALPPRSKIVFTVSVNVVLDGSTRPGYGVCGVGGWNDNNSLSIVVPAGTAAGEQTFTAEFEISALLALQPAGNQIAVNPYNGATVTKAELFKPKT